MSTLYVDTITEKTSGNGVVIPGHVIQTVYNEFTDTTVTTTTYAYVDVTGSDVTITTKQANSKIYLLAICPCYATGTCTGFGIGFKRGSTLIDGVAGSSGDPWQYLNGSSIATISLVGERQHLDSPSVAAGTSLTYKVQLGLWSAGQITLNYAGYGVKSKFLVQEIAQ
jgi:hypothetical protein